MNRRFEELANRLVECLTPVNAVIASEILARMCAEEHFAASYRFEVSAETVRQLTGILALNETLALDFRDAVWASRQLPKLVELVQQAVAVGRYQVQRERLDLAMVQVRSPILRQRFARYLNEVDGELGMKREAFATGDLARRINRAAGALIVDGLQLHGLVHALAANPAIWEVFRAFSAESNRTQPISHGRPDR
jgi:hypothetical protein